MDTEIAEGEIMSLVDYASSSDEDEDERNHIADQQQAKVTTAEQPRQEPSKIVAERRRLESTVNQPPASKFDHPRPHTTQHLINKRSGSSVNKAVSERLDAAALKLPDASLLLSSPALPSHLENATDHSSRVAAAMAESESRKRDLKGSSSSDHTRNTVRRGNLPHSKRVPDLLPPQLTGRGNIVTEDISKLFVKRHVGSSSE